MYRAIARNKRNTFVILVVFFAIIAALAWLANAAYGSGGYVIFIVVLVIAAIYALVQYFSAGSQAVALSGARPVTKDEAPRLWRTVENLTIATGLPMPKVYVIDDPAPNAFATGRDPDHAVVAATSGLLGMMDDAQLEAVMAHELGHVRNYDIRVSMIVFGLVVAVGIVADIFLRMSFYGGLRGGRNNNNGGNPVVLVGGLVAMIAAPLVATLVQLAVSRQREYLADATSAMTTRNPEALAGALAKLGEYGRPMARQSSAMSHLWIADPARPGLAARLLSTHPPIADHIARLQKMGGGF
ncbi:MAG TPA: M48 family metalloprotease [Microbacteriaceae bacterium]|nr:M48 family metalloprotease [Microbacteriaceae bacterium]